MKQQTPRRPISYPEICFQGSAGLVLKELKAAGKIKDIHDLASRMDSLSLLRQDSGRTDLFIQWSLHQWEASSKPLFVLEQDLAWALANTEPPMEKFDLLPEIPIDGMYISLPPIFDLDGGTTGNHKVEGLFLTKNEVLVPKSGLEHDGPAALVESSDMSKYEVVPSITILGIGEDKNKNKANSEAWLRDDAVIYFSLVPGKPLYIVKDKHLGVVELTRVVANLLYLLQNTHELSSQKDPDIPSTLLGDSRTARRERDRAFEKGRSCVRHTVWKLSTMETKKSPPVSEPGEEPVRKIRGHIVLGHIHRYWVLDPAGKKSLGTKIASTKTKGDRTYHLVVKWLLPYTRGEGPVEHAPTVLIR